MLQNFSRFQCQRNGQIAGCLLAFAVCFVPTLRADEGVHFLGEFLNVHSGSRFRPGVMRNTVQTKTARLVGSRFLLRRNEPIQTRTVCGYAEQGTGSFSCGVLYLRMMIWGIVSAICASRLFHLCCL